MILNGRRFNIGIQMRRNPPDHFDGAHTMRDRHDSVTIHSFARRPFAPFAVDLARRVDQNPIKIEQNG